MEKRALILGVGVLSQGTGWLLHLGKSSRLNSKEQVYRSSTNLIIYSEWDVSNFPTGPQSSNLLSSGGGGCPPPPLESGQACGCFLHQHPMQRGFVTSQAKPERPCSFCLVHGSRLSPDCQVLSPTEPPILPQEATRRHWAAAPAQPSRPHYPGQRCLSAAVSDQTICQLSTTQPSPGCITVKSWDIIKLLKSYDLSLL